MITRIDGPRGSAIRSGPDIFSLIPNLSSCNYGERVLRRIAALIGVSATLACAPAAPSGDASAGNPLPGDAPTGAAASGDIRPVVRAFYEHIGTFDVAALDTLLTEEFEIVDGGFRMDGPDFLFFLQGLREQGFEFDFRLSDWNTRIEGTVAYTLLTSVNRPLDATFHESAILRWDGGRWRIDRFQSTPAR
ncbi:MAG: nuclear transport factor 2 family protein [Gemmatimonadetes bacterium]|nr:nuclear transport factor 2 family protein [Gemmatimonadota bacterium]